MLALRNGIELVGEILHFSWSIIVRVLTGRVLRFFGEAVRQAGVFITGSVGVIFLMVFALGLQCGIQAAYGVQAVGAPSVSGAFTALCNLREVAPYAFGYMMAAKVGTGIVAELGAMRISDEIDALEVMGFDPVNFLAATRLLGMMVVLPFVFVIAMGVAFAGSYVAVVIQIARVSPAAYLEIFWVFQTPTDLVFSLVKGMTMSGFVILVACYFGYNASGGPVGVGTATARSMAVNIVGIHAIGLLTTQLFWGGDPRSPVGG
ncbi:MAG: ABC transporter permease [Solirubrobacteraceae bacterium]|nr:ABC transporter permease [Solirubrobacteraceae bacterium]